MKNKVVKCNKINISNSKQFTLIAGPCQLENEKHALDVAATLKEITKKLNIDLNLRPQNLSLDTYYKITKEYENLRN